jgi:hypothetical protein
MTFRILVALLLAWGNCAWGAEVHGEWSDRLITSDCRFLLPKICGWMKWIWFTPCMPWQGRLAANLKGNQFIARQMGDLVRPCWKIRSGLARRRTAGFESAGTGALL